MWSAHDDRLDRDVALKFVRLTNDRSRTQFVREGQAIAALDHPNILQVFDVHTTSEHGVLSMQLCSRSLHTARLAWHEATPLFEAIGTGLIAIHDAGSSIAISSLRTSSSRPMAGFDRRLRPRPLGDGPRNGSRFGFAAVRGP